jgi:hypothetical protein
MNTPSFLPTTRDLPGTMASILLLVALAVVTASISYRINKRRRHLPPGPKPDPVLGNVRHMPFENAHQAYLEWSKTYGSLHLLVTLLAQSSLVVVPHR